MSRQTDTPLRRSDPSSFVCLRRRVWTIRRAIACPSTLFVSLRPLARMTRELTQRVMVAKGLNDGDKVLARSIALRIVQTLRLKRTKLDGKEKRKGVSI
jgi:hypothetical protein